MQRFIFFGIGLLIVLMSPVCFFVIRNEIAAAQLRSQLLSAPLPDKASVIFSSDRVFNSGNGDGCDYQAIVIVESFGSFDTLRASYIDLFTAMSNGTLKWVKDDPPRGWHAKSSGSFTEFSIVPNTEDAWHYMVSATTFARKAGLDFRCW